MDKKTKEILEVHKDTTEKVRQALKLADVPEPLIEQYLTRVPDFSKMIPEDVINFYKSIKVQFILYLSEIGFSEREISRRLSGASHTYVKMIIDQYKKKVELSNPDEVSE